MACSSHPVGVKHVSEAGTDFWNGAESEHGALGMTPLGTSPRTGHDVRLQSAGVTSRSRWRFSAPDRDTWRLWHGFEAGLDAGRLLGVGP